MKKLVLVLTVAFTSSVFAASVERAQELWNARGEDRENAKFAAEEYKALVAETADKVQKGKFMTSQSQALYYYGNTAATDGEREDIHNKGADVGEKAADLLEDNKGSDTDVALAKYFYAINLGKWGQARGIGSSLAKLGPMYRALKKVVKLDKTVEGFGAYRTLGRLNHKVPEAAAAARLFVFKWGVKEAAEYYKKGYDATLVRIRSIKTSSNTTTTLYYLDALSALGKREEFCRVFKQVKKLHSSPASWVKLDANRVPETTNDLNALMKCVESKDDEVCVKLDFAAPANVHTWGNQADCFQ